jgi:hypothetical protein
VRSPFTVEGGQGLETSALPHSVNEEARSFRLLPKGGLPPAKGARVHFTLIHDGLRLAGSGRVLDARTGILELSLPDTLEIKERRRGPRARISPKEGATLTALQDLFAGVGLFGTLENLGEGGARMRVDRAVAIGSEKQLVLGGHLVLAGQAFLVIKLNKVPRCPAVMEVAGQAAYLVQDGTGLALGLAFGKPSGPVASALAGLVAQRCPPIPAALPAKARRLPERAGDFPTAPLAAPSGAKGLVPPPAEPAEAPSGPANPADRRHSPRLTLGKGYHARFLVGDLLVDAADLVDLSAGGCCLRLPLDRCAELQKGVNLDEFHLIHPDLPQGILPGRVRWLMGRPPGPDEGTRGRYCLVGVEFLEPPEALVASIRDYIARHLP